MNISELRGLLKDKFVVEEVNKHLWIESQKAGYSIGIEKATEDWLTNHAMDWMKFNMPEKYDALKSKKRKKTSAKKRRS